MFDCYVHLCAFVYSIANPGYPYIISEEETRFVPLKYKISKEDRSIKDCVYNIIDICINRQPKSINTFLMEIILQDNEIHIYYVCVLPLDSKIATGYRIPAQSFMHVPLLAKAIQYV